MVTAVRTVVKLVYNRVTKTRAHIFGVKMGFDLPTLMAGSVVESDYFKLKELTSESK